jgi:hypothetical protein
MYRDHDGRRAMPSKFERERSQVALLMRRRGLAPTEYQDPQAGGHARDETGADVIALIDGQRVGIQVTDLDTGDLQGEARAAETKLARDAERRDSTYATLPQNQLERMIAAIANQVSRKSRMSFAGFDDFWLLVSCGIPQFGAVASTLVLTPWLDTEALDAATAQSLSASKYTRTFIHVALGLEEQALYEWRRGGSWSKSTLAVPPQYQGPSFWDCRRNPDLFRDPDGWCDREVKRFFAGRRGDS